MIWHGLISRRRMGWFESNSCNRVLCFRSGRQAMPDSAWRYGRGFGRARNAGMTSRSIILHVAIGEWKMTVLSVRAIHWHRCCGDWCRIRTQRPCLESETESEKQGSQKLHAARLFGCNGQRMKSRIVPAIASAKPPTANANSHQVLKFSWFFQSMMWRLQKKS